MKYLVVVVFCVVHSIAAYNFSWQERDDNCAADTGNPHLTEQKVKQTLRNFVELGTRPPTSIKKFILCALKSYQVLTDEAKLSKDFLEANKNEAGFEAKFLNAVKSAKDTVPEDYAFKVLVLLEHPEVDSKRLQGSL